MKIKMNLTGNFTLVPEGERILTITKAECTPSGKPSKMKVTFQDSEGGFINSIYNFDNDKSLFAMGKMLEVALGFEDGDEFDTKSDPEKLVGKKVLCTVIHSQGTRANDKGEFPTFANINRVLELVEDDVADSPRNSLPTEDDDDDLD